MISYPYIILIFILLVCSFLYWRTKQKNFFYFSTFIVFCFIAFRAPVVGADTWNYVKYFTGKQASYSYTDNRALEPFFLLYNWILSSFTNSSFIYLFMNTTISLAPVYYLIKKYSYNKVLSLALFFLLNNYTVYFIALRQILALSFVLWALIFVIEKRKYHWWWFTLFSVISYFFHTSSIIVVIVYLGAYIISVNNRWVYIAGIIISYVIGLLFVKESYMEIFSYILNNSFTNRLSGYSEVYEATANSSFFSYIKITIVGLFVFLVIDKDKLNNWLVKIYFVSIPMYNLFYHFPILYRSNIGFELMLLIVVTWCFGKDYHRNSSLRLAIDIASSLIILALTFSFIENNVNPDLSDPGRLHPYYFFFEDYSDHPSIRRF